MIPEAYQSIHQLEQNHWWYIGARAVYRTLLKIGLGPPDGQKKMLEVGVGTGGNLELLAKYGPTGGIDFSPLALERISEPPQLGLCQASAEALPFLSGTFDGVALLGLIEHLDDDVKALAEARLVCRPGGTVILLTSAFQSLWSHHDEANQHRRRYRRKELSERIVVAGLEPLRLTYMNFFTFLPVFLVRWWQCRRPREPEYDMGNPPAIINTLLKIVMSFEAWMVRYFPLPIGVNLVAVCRPKGDVGE